MGVGKITHTRVPYNTLKVTNALGEVCVIRDGLHHLQSCAIRSLAAHLAKNFAVHQLAVYQCSAIEGAVTQV